MIETNRRSLITGLISLMVAPAIVRAQSLMPVRQMLEAVAVPDGPFYRVVETYTSSGYWQPFTVTKAVSADEYPSVISWSQPAGFGFEVRIGDLISITQ